MNDRVKTIHDIPSLNNSGIKVAPYSNTSQFMELHKLDYKRHNLLDKLQKSEREIKNVKRNLALIERDMAEMMSKIKFENVDQLEGSVSNQTNTKKSQLLKY